MRITRPFVLLALAALLAPRIEASRTSAWERNPPAAAVVAKADAASALASLTPAAAADIEAAEPPIFDLGDVVLVDRELVHEDRFDLGPLTLVDLNLLRGPPPSYPETRVGGFELLPPFRVGASPSLSLWGRQACGFSCLEVVSDSRYDPWGLRSDEDPRSNPDVAAQLALAEARQQAAGIRERAAARRRGPTISGIEGNPLRGGLYWAFDTAVPVGLSEEGTSISPLSGAGQAPADLRAFKKRYSKGIFAIDAVTALRSPGAPMKVLGLLGAVGGLREREGTPGTSEVLRHEERLDAGGRHVVSEVTRMTKEAEELVEAGSGKSSDAARYAKYKDAWFSFFFRGRAIQAETELLLLDAAKNDAMLQQVMIRPRMCGLVPDFLYRQVSGEEVILDVTSPRRSTYEKILKYARTGEEILVEIYHQGKGKK